MTAIASTAQLRMSLLRWSLVCVPAVLLLGTLAGRIAGAGQDNPWFAALAKPDFMPPGWAFGAAWTLLYILLGLALAMIVNARGARGRGVALAFFLFQLLLNYAWPTLFFAFHEIGAAFTLLVLMIVLTAVAAFLFSRIRAAAGLLLLPYLAWLIFAALLIWQLGLLNPGAARLAPDAASADIAL
jgi:benzodiazapine receptor